MKRSKNLDRAIIVFVVLLFFGVVYYAGIETGKRMIITKEAKEEEVKEAYTSPATSVGFKVYGELVEEVPPPITAPSPITTPPPSISEAPTEAIALKTEQLEVQPPKKEIKKEVKKEEKKKEVAKVPSYPQKTIYTIQVASLKSKEEAQRMVTRLHKKGYPVYMVSARVGGVVYYRVRIGEFRSASEAEKMKEKIERLEKLKAFITLKER
jgi:cell division protein FtsN